MRVLVSGPEPEPVLRALEELKAGMQGAELLGPAPLLRLRGKHRAQLVAKTEHPRRIASQAARLLASAAPAMRRAQADGGRRRRSAVALRHHDAVKKGPRPEDVIGEWGVRDVTPPSQKERKALDAESDLNPLVGKPLRRRLRNFVAEPDSYLASLGGPLPYMRRLREIERETDRQLEALAAAYEEHRDDAAGVAACSPSAGTSARSNELIEKHNRWFPAEARLKMNPRTRDFVEVGGKPYRREPLDAAWILDRFPADR